MLTGLVQHDRCIWARVVAAPPEFATGGSVHAFLGACRSATDNRPPSIMRFTSRLAAEWNAVRWLSEQKRLGLPRPRPGGSEPAHQRQRSAAVGRSSSAGNRSPPADSLCQLV